MTVQGAMSCNVRRVVFCRHSYPGHGVTEPRHSLILTNPNQRADASVLRV